MLDFQQAAWDEQTINDCRRLIALAVREDLDRGYDWTTVSLVPPNAQAAADVVARQQGVVAGLLAADVVCREMNLDARWEPRAVDGQSVQEGDVLARLSGSARDLLTAERTILNFLGRLSGVATMTKRFVDKLAG